MLREGLISKRRNDGHSVFSLFKRVALGFVYLSTSAALRADDHTCIPAYAAGKVESPFPAWLEFPIGTSRWTPSVHNSREKAGLTAISRKVWYRGAGWEGDLLKKILEAVKKDLWVVLLDVVAVNLSYYLALLIRFYVNFQLRPVAVDRYLPAWESFTPWYTVLCVLIFAGFRLYGGLWRYAGINDMNRIILASLSTALLHVLGTTIFYTRMPVTYYLIGALLQFLFLTIIRFSYRVLLVEKKRLRRGQKVRCLVVGSGENGRRVVKHLEEEGTFEPVAIYSSSTHSSSSSSLMDGIPVVGELKLENVGAVFIADPLLPTSTRQEIKEQADAAGADVQDYTGFFSNLGGRLSLTELLSTIHGPFTISIDGKDTRYEDGAAALESLKDKYEVKEIVGDQMKIVLERGRVMSTQERLAQAYAAVAGDPLLTSSSSSNRKDSRGRQGGAG